MPNPNMASVSSHTRQTAAAIVKRNTIGRSERELENAQDGYNRMTREWRRTATSQKHANCRLCGDDKGSSARSSIEQSRCRARPRGVGEPI